ncbi:hypothetical protein [Paludibaculum fermentans]|uniref:PilZ domain-containing protein n=1 Tax=Paludibaculum fermentans TaxID=1473598 RepID=A0A7S7NUG2_PALFE|nr:hypothetical protein [Paludibaculum fermentans]QOY89997.1 hypothetical protein IRI77_08580 [Paludibaculum fermentans]
MSEKREKQRRTSIGKVRLAWVDNGGAYYQEKPNLLNCSDSGICVMLTRRIAPQTLVGVHSEDHGHIANAVVRHVTQHGLRFRIGLEFPSEVAGGLSKL